MVTAKNTRYLPKREVMYLSHCLQGLDVDLMKAFVVKKVEAVEFQVTCREASVIIESILRRMMEFLKDTFSSYLGDIALALNVSIASLPH